MALTGDQTTRRAVYGVNVAVAVVAAVVITLLFNWFFDWAYGRLGPSARPWVRYDLTATRAHTLSPQTRAVLGELAEPATLTGLFRDDDPQRRAVADLLQEYARAGGAVTAEVLHPERDPVALRELLTAVGEAFEPVIGPLRRALDSGNRRLLALAEGYEQEAASFAQAAAALDPADTLTPTVSELLAVAEADFTQRAGQYRQAAGLFADALAEPLPPLEVSRERMARILRESRSDQLPKLDRWLGQQAGDRLLPPGVRNAMLEAQRRLAELPAGLERAITDLGLATGDAAYQRLCDTLRAQDCVVVRYGDRVTAVPLGDMYRQDPSGGERSASAVAPVRFLGEERLTGALLAVAQPVPPVVVLVTGDGRPATGQAGRYNLLAQRLQYGGFEVAEWHAVPTDGGTTVTAAPRLPDQRRVVWLVLPFDAANPAAAAAKQVVAKALRERLALGDGVLLVPGFRRDAAFAQRDPLIDFAAKRGLAVEPGHLLMYATATPRQRHKAEQTFRVSDWPEGSPLSAALDGRAAWFEFAHPLTLDRTATPLVTLRGDTLWVERDPLATERIADARPDPGEAAPAQPIAGAVEPPGAGRLAVVADDLWLTDTVVLERDAGGNLELGVHAVYWLARLDHAIAPTPSMQAVRRIGPMTPMQRHTVRWVLLAALPGAALLAGVGVWLVRRRG